MAVQRLLQQQAPPQKRQQQQHSGTEPCAAPVPALPLLVTWVCQRMPGPELLAVVQVLQPHLALALYVQPEQVGKGRQEGEALGVEARGTGEGLDTVLEHSASMSQTMGLHANAEPTLHLH